MHSNNYGSCEKDFKPSRPSPFPPHTPPNNVVDEDLIEIVENDVGNIECSYITSKTLLEREGGEIKTILHYLQKICYDLAISLNTFCERLEALFGMQKI